MCLSPFLHFEQSLTASFTIGNLENQINLIEILPVYSTVAHPWHSDAPLSPVPHLHHSMWQCSLIFTYFFFLFPSFFFFFLLFVLSSFFFSFLFLSPFKPHYPCLASSSPQSCATLYRPISAVTILLIVYVSATSAIAFGFHICGVISSLEISESISQTFSPTSTGMVSHTLHLAHQSQDNDACHPRWKGNGHCP